MFTKLGFLLFPQDLVYWDNTDDGLYNYCK